MKNVISNLLTFCEPIKNFEVLNLDNINILYNFTRQKEGSLKCQLGSPFVHNLYRMVSGIFSFYRDLYFLCTFWRNVWSSNKPQEFKHQSKFWEWRKRLKKVWLVFISYHSDKRSILSAAESFVPSVVKAPKTIHRCILKTSLSTKSQGSGAQLACHVCLASYRDYNAYFRHLVDRWWSL